MHKKTINYEKLYQDCNTLFRKSSLFVKENGIRQIEINKNKLFLQIFYAKDRNYNEKESIKIEIIDKIVNFENNGFLEPLNFRIDLVNQAGFKIDNLIINDERVLIKKLNTNGLFEVGNSLISINNDPWIEINNVDHLKISFAIRDYNDEIRDNYYSSNYLKENDLIKAKKYVKGFFRAKLIFLMAGKIPLDMIVIKNSRGEILKSFYNYDFEIN